MPVARSGVCAQRASSRRCSYLAAAVAALSAIMVAACSGERLIDPSEAGTDAPPLTPGTLSALPTSAALGAPMSIDFDTYENSHQVAHPSAVSFDAPWHGQRYWLAITPYPNSDSRVENPSLYVSATGDAWLSPAGLANPLETTQRGYLSDPELVYDPAADELRLYYREVVERRHGKKTARHDADIFYLTRSGDGVHWSTPVAVASAHHTYVVSPAVARRGAGDWSMWAVDAGAAGCTARHTRIVMRSSLDGVGWSLPRPVGFTQPGYVPWHLDVQWVSHLGQYWALVAAYPRHETCTRTSLFLATSADGLHWTTYPAPVLARGAVPEFSTNVYRSTFVFEPGSSALTIWLSGAATVASSTHRREQALKWSAAVWHTDAAALLAHVRTVDAPSQRRVPADTEPAFLRSLAAGNALP